MQCARVKPADNSVCMVLSRPDGLGCVWYTPPGTNGKKKLTESVRSGVIVANVAPAATCTDIHPPSTNQHVYALALACPGTNVVDTNTLNRHCACECTKMLG